MKNNGIFYFFMLTASAALLSINYLNYLKLPYFLQGGFIVAFIAPAAIFVISVIKLYKYLSIEKLEEDLKMEV